VKDVSYAIIPRASVDVFWTHHQGGIIDVVRKLLQSLSMATLRRIEFSEIAMELRPDIETDIRSLDDGPIREGKVLLRLLVPLEAHVSLSEEKVVRNELETTCAVYLRRVAECLEGAGDGKLEVSTGEVSRRMRVRVRVRVRCFWGGGVCVQDLRFRV